MNAELSGKLFRPDRRANLRRGWGLLQVVGGIFAGSLVLGVCVPLFLTAQRQADLSGAQARMHLQAREISGHFREDVRQASTVQVAANGQTLRLIRPSATQPALQTVVRYERSPQGLLREVQSSNGETTERSVYTAALKEARFGRAGHTVTARLDFAHAQYGRTLEYHLDCAATPRSSE